MPFFPELGQLSPEVLRDWFLDETREKKVPEDEGDLWLGEVAIQIARTGAGGIAFLLSCLSWVDDLRLRSALLGLSFSERLSPQRRAEVCGAVRPLLSDSRPLIVAEAVDTLSHLGCRDVLEGVRALLPHLSPYVVGSVLRFLARHAPEKAVPILQEALQSREPIVRQNAVDELDDLGHVPSLPKMRKLLEDPDKDVRQAASTAVENLEEMQGG
jgi:hypothetical protein